MAASGYLSFAMFFRRSPPAAATPPSDQEVLARYRAHGDVAELGRLYDRYLPEAFAVARRYLAPPDEDAQDATMQLFEHLVKVLRTHAPDNFPAWLHATARNYCLMQLRARKRAGPNAGPLLLSFPDAAGVEWAAARHLPDAAEAAEDAQDAEQRLQGVEAALAQLPPAQRRCLELFYLEKKSYREIAAATGLDLGLVRSHLQNGKRMLRRQFDSPEKIEKIKPAARLPLPAADTPPRHAAR